MESRQRRGSQGSRRPGAPRRPEKARRSASSESSARSSAPRRDRWTSRARQRGYSEESLRAWVRPADVVDGQERGVNSEQAARIRTLRAPGATRPARHRAPPGRPRRQGLRAVDHEQRGPGHVEATFSEPHEEALDDRRVLRVTFNEYERDLVPLDVDAERSNATVRSEVDSVDHDEEVRP